MVHHYRNVRSASYWALVSREMEQTGQSQPIAELTVFIRTVLKARKEGHSHVTIKKRLIHQWGLTQGSYYRRLTKARSILPIP